MKFKDGFPALRRIFKIYLWNAAGLRWCKCQVTGNLTPIVATSVDVDIEADGEEERFSTDTAKVGDSIGAEIHHTSYLHHI